MLRIRSNSIIPQRIKQISSVTSSKMFQTAKFMSLPAVMAAIGRSGSQAVVGGRLPSPTSPQVARRHAADDDGILRFLFQGRDASAGANHRGRRFVEVQLAVQRDDLRPARFFDRGLFGRRQQEVVVGLELRRGFGQVLHRRARSVSSPPRSSDSSLEPPNCRSLPFQRKAAVARIDQRDAAVAHAPGHVAVDAAAPQTEDVIVLVAQLQDRSAAVAGRLGRHRFVRQRNGVVRQDQVLSAGRQHVGIQRDAALFRAGHVEIERVEIVELGAQAARRGPPAIRPDVSSRTSLPIGRSRSDRSRSDLGCAI